MKRKGFTLIELLVVIAIILILIAIGLPKFLESQIRARATKVQSELRTVGLALESYRLDWKIYPSRSVQYYRNKSREEQGLTWLLKPIEYLTYLPDDPFPTGTDAATGLPGAGPASYILTGVDVLPTENALAHPHGGILLRTWVLYSAGPDSPRVEVDSEKGCMAINANGQFYFGYSPTNGTRSRGDIWRFGGEKEWMGLDVTRTSRGCTGSKATLDTTPKVGVYYNGIKILQRFPEGGVAQ
ncbi:MAG: prepilin-type N-terminal cleavage/methylation domain-containing protein [Candidatus Omnitrophica bacterium]|nr:prepilin-type N-terminal cleavage/methylation domain-containing protein [Candidatus Omnitrophota bacterium]